MYDLDLSSDDDPILFDGVDLARHRVLACILCYTAPHEIRNIHLSYRQLCGTIYRFFALNAFREYDVLDRFQDIKLVL